MTQHGAHGLRPLPPTTQHGAHGPRPLPPMIQHGVHGAPAIPHRLQQLRPAQHGLAAQLLQHTTPTCQPRSRALSHRGLVLLLRTTATTPRGCSHSRRALHQLWFLLPPLHQPVRISQPGAHGAPHSKKHKLTFHSCKGNWHRFRSWNMDCHYWVGTLTHFIRFPTDSQ
jgi:hypothetical protein